MFRAPSWSGPRNWERANTKIKWEETGERKGGPPLAPLLPDHGLFFHLPFNCASSLLSESLFQALLLQTVKTFPDAKDILLLLLFIIHSQYSIGHVYMSAYLPSIFEWNHIFYNKKNGTPLIRTPMGHATVSVLSGLILEKVYEFFVPPGKPKLSVIYRSLY